MKIRPALFSKKIGLQVFIGYPKELALCEKHEHVGDKEYDEA